MSYKKYIEECYSDCSFNPASSLELIEDLSNQIGGLPAELHSFLMECDGARFGDLVTILSIKNYGGYTFKSVIDEWSDIEYKNLYPNAQNLFFFADDGMGGFFGYVKKPDENFGQIVYWGHENDEVIPIREAGLKGFISTCEEYLE